jgi:hypothetical protein
MSDGGLPKRLGPSLVKAGISTSLSSASLLGLKMATSDWVESICYDSKRKKWGE